MGEGESMGKVPEVGRVQDTTKELKGSQRGWATESGGRASVSFFFNIYLLIWLHWVLIAARRIFNLCCSM